MGLRTADTVSDVLQLDLTVTIHQSCGVRDIHRLRSVCAINASFGKKLQRLLSIQHSLCATITPCAVIDSTLLILFRVA